MTTKVLMLGMVKKDKTRTDLSPDCAALNGTKMEAAKRRVFKVFKCLNGAARVGR